MDVHPERGFLPAIDPLRELPHGFAAWEERARDLGRWIVSGRVRQAIDWMPLLDPGALADGPELRRAMLLLSFLGHAYVWSGTRPAQRSSGPSASAPGSRSGIQSIAWRTRPETIQRPRSRARSSHAAKPCGSSRSGSIAGRKPRSGWTSTATESAIAEAT
ncbi:MAG TPA: hypothetical protein VNE71_03215 [Myxococcota bacterium]|nr:hypothetical protein [Myxococcota bacterium]